MNYTRPETLEPLAAEYVLGTLRGPARRRFERLLTDSAVARDAVWRWEARLGELALGLAPEPPPPAVWQGISGRLPVQQPASAGLGDRLWRSVLLWRAWGLLATAAALVLALLWWPAQAPAPLPAAERVAVVADADEQPLWVIRLDLATGRLLSRALNPQAAAVDRVFELWALPTSGAPQSLGLLPAAGSETATTLSPALVALLRTAPAVAVSLEPVGGSPTGAPTGPVLYSAGAVTLAPRPDSGSDPAAL